MVRCKILKRKRHLFTDSGIKLRYCFARIPIVVKTIETYRLGKALKAEHEHIHKYIMLHPKRIKKYGLIVSFLILGFSSNAAIYFTRASGDWNNTSTWSTTSYGGAAAASTPGSAPGDIVMLSGVTVTLTATPANALASVIISQNYNSGNDTKLLLNTAGTTLTCNSLSMTDNDRNNNVDLEISDGTLQVNGNASFTRTTSNSRTRYVRLNIHNNGRMNVTSNLNYTYGRANNSGDAGNEVQISNDGILNIDGNLNCTVGNNNGNSNEFRFQMNDNAVCNVLGNVTLTLSNSTDGDDLIYDINGGNLAVTGAFSATVNNTCNNANALSMFIDGGTVSTGAFSFTQNGGGTQGDMSLFMNQSSTAVAASLSVAGDLTFAHSDGDNMEIETNANATLTVTGILATAITSSADGDNLILDFNGGTVNAASITSNLATGATSANNLQWTVDGTTVNVTGDLYIYQSGGGTGDAYIYMNQASTVSPAAFNVGGNLIFTHLGGDNMEIELNNNASMTINGSLLDTLTSTDGDIFYIDVNGGSLTVQQDFTHYQPGPGSGTEDLDIRIDGSGSLSFNGDVNISQTSGDDVIFYLNNVSGTTANIHIGGDLIYNHTGGDDFLFQMNGNSTFTIDGNFTTTYNTSDGDLFYLDLNGGIFNIGSNFSLTQTAAGGTTEDVLIYLDGTAQLNTAGSFTVNHENGDDFLIYLNNASGSAAAFTVGTNFNLNHNAGNDFLVILNGASSVFTINGNFATSWNNCDADRYYLDINGGVFTVGGNYSFTQTATGGSTEDWLIYIDNSGRMNTTGNFNVTHATGDKAYIYLNNSAGTDAQFTVGGDFTMNHTGGDDFSVLLASTASVFAVTGDFTSTWTSSDGDLYYLDINGGTFTVSQDYTSSTTAGVGTVEDMRIRIDGAGQMNVTGDVTLDQVSGNDVNIFLNNGSGSTAQLNIGGDLNLNHSGGDDFEIQLDGATSLLNITGDFNSTWTSADGDDFYIDLNAGRMTVNGNLTHANAIAGGTSEDFDLRLDGAARLDIYGTLSINQLTGNNIIFYLNNASGTTAQYHGGSISIDHATGATGVFFEINQTSSFNLTGNFTINNNSNGGDIARFRTNGTPTITIAGNFIMNQLAGATGFTDQVELDHNGGAFSVGGDLTMNLVSGNDAIITVDGNTTVLTVTGTLSLTHSGGDDNYVTLGAAAGSPTINLGALTMNDSGGDITYFRLSNSSIANITGNITMSALAAAQVDIALYSSSQLRIGGNFIRAATPSRFGVLSCTNTSTVTYNGSSPQIIAGDAGSTDAFLFGNIAIDNETGFTMNAIEGNVTIPSGSSLTFTDGVINATSSAMFIIANGASVIGANDNSYIDGPIRKVGNTAFTFPIGDDGNYQPATISAPSNVAHHFTGQYVSADPDPSYDEDSKDVSIDHISSCEYWIIDRTNGASSVSVTLNWDAGSCGVDDLTSMRVAQWDGSAWRDRGQGSTTGTTAAGTVNSSAAVAAWAVSSPFTLASSNGNNPLPVELVKFDVKAEDVRARLDWATASEKENAYFNVERSGDGKNFIKVGQVNGAGNSYTLLNYSWFDNQPLQGISYYRLKQVDYNGEFEYSNIKSCYFKNGRENKGFVIYPNPNSGDKIYLRLESSLFAQSKVDIYDMKGVKVYESLSPLMEDAIHGVIQMPEQLKEGVYLVSLTSGEVTEKQMLVIRK